MSREIQSHHLDAAPGDRKGDPSGPAGDLKNGTPSFDRPLDEEIQVRDQSAMHGIVDRAIPVQRLN